MKALGIFISIAFTIISITMLTKVASIHDAGAAEWSMTLLFTMTALLSIERTISLFREKTIQKSVRPRQFDVVYFDAPVQQISVEQVINSLRGEIHVEQNGKDASEGQKVYVQALEVISRSVYNTELTALYEVTSKSITDALVEPYPNPWQVLLSQTQSERRDIRKAASWLSAEISKAAYPETFLLVLETALEEVIAERNLLQDKENNAWKNAYTG